MVVMTKEKRRAVFKSGYKFLIGGILAVLLCVSVFLAVGLSNYIALGTKTGEAVIPKRAADGEVVAMRAFVTAARGFSLDGDDLKKRLAENLPAYMIPKVVRVLRAMPVTGNGKTDRKALELL